MPEPIDLAAQDEEEASTNDENDEPLAVNELFISTFAESAQPDHTDVDTAIIPTQTEDENTQS